MRCSVGLILIFLAVPLSSRAGNSCEHVSLPNGLVSICNDRIVAKSENGGNLRSVTIKDGYELFPWQGNQGNDKGERFFKVGDDYIVPVLTGSGGNATCNGPADGDNYPVSLYVAVIRKAGQPLIKALGRGRRTSWGCRSLSQIYKFDGGLEFSLGGDDELVTRRWQFRDGKFTELPTLKPEVPAGYHLIGSVGEDGLPVHGGIPLVKDLTTPFGRLAFATDYTPPITGLNNHGYTTIGALSLAGVDIPKHNLIPSPEGFVPHVFQIGKQSVVIVEGRPDEVSEERFQIIAIDPHHIRFSHVFGTGYGYIAYHRDGQKLDFAVGRYIKVPFYDGGIMHYGVNFAFRYFAYSADHLSTSTKSGILGPYAGGGLITRPTDSSQPWFYITTGFTCEPMKGSMQFPASPAALIQFDQINNHMADQVLVLARDSHGTPTKVVISEPLLESRYEFIRGRARCEIAASRKRKQLQGLE